MYSTPSVNLPTSATTHATRESLPDFFAIVDLHTGLLWGTREATSPITACQQLDREIDPSAAAERSYVEVNRVDAFDGGYSVFRVPDAELDAAQDWSADDATTVEAVCGEPVAWVAFRRAPGAS